MIMVEFIVFDRHMRKNRRNAFLEDATTYTFISGNKAFSGKYNLDSRILQVIWWIFTASPVFSVAH